MGQLRIPPRRGLPRPADPSDSSDVTTWRKRSKHHFDRAAVADVIVDCTGGPDGRRTRFRSMLVIKAPPARDLKLLHGVGGDQLAAVANAVRAALGLPARSWP